MWVYPLSAFAAPANGWIITTPGPQFFTSTSIAAATSSSAVPKSAPQIRKEFPETWLWESEEPGLVKLPCRSFSIPVLF
jgi:hypothetical protein